MASEQYVPSACPHRLRVHETPPPRGGGPTVEWTVRTERPSDYYVTYWIDIKNLRAEQTSFEVRYAVLGW